MNPLVTVITPSLNQGEFIERTILSVLQQDYPSIEYLVFDAGSSDGTREILQRYNGKLQAVIAPDQGQADAVNRGLKAARGELIGWLNSDDIYLPGAVRAAVGEFQRYRSCAAVYGEAQYIDAEDRIIRPYPTGSVEDLRNGCFICQPAVFLRRSFLQTVGFLDPDLRYCMDYDLWLRIAAHGSMRYVPRYLAGSRLHAEAKSVAEQLAARREVVQMTRRRLGASPLTVLYGYADFLTRQQLRPPLDDSSTAGFGRRLAVSALTVLLAMRYHPRPTRHDWRLLLARLSSGKAFTPAPQSGRHASGGGRPGGTITVKPLHKSARGRDD
jgi:glycosyltransferase involved in cell wall biosynthesis